MRAYLHLKKKKSQAGNDALKMSLKRGSPQPFQLTQNRSLWKLKIRKSFFNFSVCFIFNFLHPLATVTVSGTRLYKTPSGVESGLFLCLFLSLWSFQLYFIPYILSTTLRFLTLFFRSYLCLISAFNYISLYESLLQP